MSFVPVAIVVEGKTEQAFVLNVLVPHLRQRGVDALPVVVQTSRTPAGHKRTGGGRWAHYERDIRNLLGAPHLAMVTTMIDFYGYPSDAPGADCCSRPHAPRRCVDYRMTAMSERIGSRRFTPYVVLHEFETLVFGAALASRQVLGNAEAADALRVEAAKVGDDVELIDDSPESSPSKRVAGCWPAYSKVTDGVAVIEEVGRAAVTEACHGLRDWVEQLAALGTTTPTEGDG